MSIGGGLEPGGLFEWASDIGDVRVELLAEVEVTRTAFGLRDVAVFPSGAGKAPVGAASLLRVLRRELIPHVRAAGFEELGSPEPGSQAAGQGVLWISRSASPRI